MRDFLEHHGVKGMKWGIRRYQNADGSLTSAGKLRKYELKKGKYVRKTAADVQDIVDSMSKKEKKMLGLRDGIYAHEDEMDHTTKRFLKKVGGTPVAFLDISYGGNGAAGVALGTRSGKGYRNKGYAKELVNEGIKWLDTPEAKDILGINTLVWWARTDNPGSIKVAEKAGFKKNEAESDDIWWGGVYRRKGE